MVNARDGQASGPGPSAADSSRGAATPASAPDAETRELEAQVARLSGRFPSYPMRYVYILMAVGAVDAADRTILSTVFEDVKLAFNVSDSQLGLLTAAYSVVATLSVIPFGWAADRWNRVRLIALGFLPWAAAMFLTGASQSFAMMFLARLFLGSIEATNGPSTPSLLGDYYPVKRRSRLFGVYGVGSLVGTLLGFAAGGIIATVGGWRMTFFIWGGLGLVCAAVVLRTLPEPARGIPDALHRAEQRLAERLARAKDASDRANDAADGSADGTVDVTTEAPIRTPVEARRPRPPGTDDYRTLTPRAAAREILRVRTMWIIFAASSVGEFIMSGLSIWAPTYFRRYFDLSAAVAGLIVAVLAISAVAGIVVGSRLGDRYLLAGEPSRRIQLGAWSRILSVATLMLAFAVPNLAVAVPFFLLSGFLIGLPMAPLDAVGLDILVSHLRGRASSLRSLIRVGATALAPLLFGHLSDRYGLRGAIVMSAPTLLAAGIITLFAVRTYPGDMAFAQAESARQAMLEDSDPVAANLPIGSVESTP